MPAPDYPELDPLAAAFLREWQSSGIPALHELPPERSRLLVRPVPGEPEHVTDIRDIELPGPGGKIPVRLYSPVNLSLSESARPPITVFLHGGGWVVGSVESHEAFCRALCLASDTVVASVEYRLAPEHRFPAAVEDTLAAIQGLHQSADQSGLDPTRIAVCGDSAGGNLATVAAISLREGPIQLAAQVLIYPITQHGEETESYRRCGQDYYLSRETMRWFWKHYLPDGSDGQDWRASPLLANDLTGVAPAWIMTAEFDPLRDEGIAYAQRLREFGVPVVEWLCPGMIHGFVRRVDLFPQAREVARWAGRALRETFSKIGD